MMPLVRGWHLELLPHCFRIESNILMSPISEEQWSRLHSGGGELLLIIARGSLMGRKTFPSDMAANEIVNCHTLICSAFHTIWSSWGDAILEDSCRILWTCHFRNFLEQINTSHIKYSNSNKQKKIFITGAVTTTGILVHVQQWLLSEGRRPHMNSINQTSTKLRVQSAPRAIF